MTRIRPQGSVARVGHMRHELTSMVVPGTRAPRNADHRGKRPIPADELVECACWCGAGTVKVSQADVIQGRTGECRRRACKAP